MEFTGGTADSAPMMIDVKNTSGPGPMDTLLLSVAGCMAVDVKMILEKSRVPVNGLRVSVEGERAQAHPKRFTRLVLAYHLEGPGEEDLPKVDRAVALSKETFCSVLHTLREDIEVEIETHLE
jgi:putative redox protein